MTNAEVERVISSARERGVTADSYAAKTFLGAREVLERDPDNRDARTTLSNYSLFLSGGPRPKSFSEFFLPIFETDEEIEASNKLRDAHLAWLAEQRG